MKLLQVTDKYSCVISMGVCLVQGFSQHRCNTAGVEITTGEWEVHFAISTGVFPMFLSKGVSDLLGM